MTGLVLKIIALTTMILDHTGCAFMFVRDTSMLRVIGRMAFPLYAFLIAEGCRHTKDQKKYMIRLGIFALVSEFPFDFLFANAEAMGPHPLYFVDWGYQNVFFTLFFGVLAIYLYESRKGWENQRLPLKNPFWYWTTWVAVAMAGLCYSDYGPLGVFFIVLVYHYGSTLAPKAARRKQILALLVMNLILYMPVSLFYAQAFAVACASLVCIYFYNGQRGHPFKWFKWFFYAMYPIHIGLLGLLWYFYIAPVLLGYLF